VNEPLDLVFSELCRIALDYSPPLAVARSGAAVLELTGDVPVPYGASRKIIPGMYFLTVQRMKGHVGLYYFAQYTDPGILEDIAPHTANLLKGKSCFHFRRPEHIHEPEIRALIESGILLYRNRNQLSGSPVR
jgi:hypothetical protein